MGWIRHHAIIVTSWHDELIEAAQAEAVRLAGECEVGPIVTDVTPPAMNSQRSFLVAPDGSKEGWGTSDQGESMRSQLIEWMNSRAYSDGSSALTWALVQFGDDYDDDRLLATDRGAIGLGRARTEGER